MAVKPQPFALIMSLSAGDMHECEQHSWPSNCSVLLCVHACLVAVCASQLGQHGRGIASIGVSVTFDVPAVHWVSDAAYLQP
jgi:hypothetical protein